MAGCKKETSLVFVSLFSRTFCNVEMKVAVDVTVVDVTIRKIFRSTIALN